MELVRIAYFTLHLRAHTPASERGIYRGSVGEILTVKVC